MAITKKRTTIVEEFDNSPTTGAPDSAYPQNVSNQPLDMNDGYIPTGDLKLDNSPKSSDITPEYGNDSSWANKPKISTTVQTISGLVTIFIAISGGIWYLSKIDSNVDRLNNDVKDHSQAIESLKKDYSVLDYKVDELKRNSAPRVENAKSD